MSNTRKLRKLLAVGQAPEPIIVFYPNQERADYISKELFFRTFPQTVPVRVVTDPKIYKRIKEGTDSAIATGQHDIIERS